MPTNNVMYARPTMAEFLLDDYEKEKRRVRLREYRNYSQNEHSKKIGIVPQTFGRFINGEKTLGVDQADRLLRWYKGSIVDQFDYREESFWDRPTVQALAALYEMIDQETEDEQDDNVRREKRENIASTIASLAQMPAEKRKQLLDLLLKIAEHPDYQGKISELLTA